MTTATSRRRGRRLAQTLAAFVVAVLAVVVPLGTVASAAPTGYTGTGDNASDFDNYGGNRVLALMTAGEPYSATLTGPQYYPTSWCWSVVSGNLPGGISMSTPGDACSPTATFSGTPVPGEFEFTLQLGDMPSPEQVYQVTFSGVIEASTSPTITTLTVPAIAPYGAIPLSATVAGNPSVGHTPTGTVEFYASGSVLVGSGTLVDGVATATGSMDSASAGSDHAITARYLGDEDYSVSTSAATSVRIFAPTAAGDVRWNGSMVSGATVALLDATDATVVIDTDVTDAAGHFEVTPGAIATLADVNKLYLLRVTYSDDTVLYHRFGSWNVDLANAEQSGPNGWQNYIVVDRRTAPVWTDATLATPRLGATYSDGVTAQSRNTVEYWLTAGSLPAGLILDGTSGAVTGTPTAGTTYDFELTANNGYGTVTQRFIGTLLPAGVAPTWDDDELPDFREGVAVSDGVVAVGDPTIGYSLSAGTLPAGLTLSATTGALVGTPTAAGPYTFTITASNDFGSITADFAGEVAAKPELDLVLDFAPGTSIDDAESTISASGLLPGSTYTLTMFSTPRVLYTGTVDASGGFTWVVKLPADTPAGAHRLLLAGIAANGTPMSAQAWFSLRSNGTIGAVSYAGPVGGGLAATGVEPWTGLAAGGVLLLLGAVALRGGRSRATRA